MSVASKLTSLLILSRSFHYWHLFCTTTGHVSQSCKGPIIKANNEGCGLGFFQTDTPRCLLEVFATVVFHLSSNVSESSTSFAGLFFVCSLLADFSCLFQQLKNLFPHFMQAMQLFLRFVLNYKHLFHVVFAKAVGMLPYSF